MTPTVKFTISLLKKFMKPYIGLVFILALSIISYNALEIFLPQIVRIYINTALNDIFNYKFLLISSIIYLGVSIVYRLIMVAITHLNMRLAWLTTNDLRVDLITHCINLDMTFHNKKKTGEMIERIDGDSTALSDFFSNFSIYFVGGLLLILGVIITTFVEGWMYGLVFLGFVLIAFISIFFIRNVVSPYWKKFRESASAMFGNIEESISGLEDIQPNGARRFIMSRFHIFSKAYFKDITKSAVYSRLYWFFVTLMDLIINLVILILSAYFADFLNIDVGTIYLLLSYARLLLSPIQVLIWQFNMMQNTLANIDRIKELFDIKSKIIDNGTKTFPEDNYNITFDNLYFSYKEEDYVLQDINFKLNTGKKIGLIGKTGSGKTTLTRLLFRLYDPNLGNIKINGSKLSDFSLENLRKNIAYVTQDVELFKASIKDNITFFDRDITDKEVLDVIKELNLSEWYESLPNGLDTILFSDELGLSAGEEQLLVLTRAFLKNPKIVILDEASSRLDPITERQIDQALEKLLSGRSAIIIAHRLQTLDKVDDIIILGNGEIIESGSRKELMKNKQSLFSKLLNTGLEGFFQ